MPRRSRSRAFSLVEILLVLALIGLSLMIAASKMDTLSPERALESASGTLRSQLEEMRHATVLQGEPATLVYDLSAGTCRMELAPPAPEPGVLPDPQAPAMESLLETELPEGIRILKIQRRGVPDTTTGELRMRLTGSGACPAHAVVLGVTEKPWVRTLRVDPLFPGVEVFEESRTFDQLFSFLQDDRQPAPIP